MFGDTEELWAGAGGSWRTIGETLDPSVVRQQDSLSCGAACGVMALRDRGVTADQGAVAAAAGGVPVFVWGLAHALKTLDITGTGVWHGGTMQIAGASRQAIVTTLNRTGSWIAFMQERRQPIGHTVMVDGLDAAGHVRIRDPWDGTRYTMTMRSFLYYWTGQAVMRR